MRNNYEINMCTCTMHQHASLHSLKNGSKLFFRLFLCEYNTYFGYFLVDGRRPNDCVWE